MRILWQKAISPRERSIPYLRHRFLIRESVFTNKCRISIRESRLALLSLDPGLSICCFPSASQRKVMKVLTHFMERGCMGVYVTHLRELGDSAEGVAPLTAMLDGSLPFFGSWLLEDT